MAPPARAEAIPPAIAPNIITSLKWLETNNLFNNLIQRNQSAAFSSGKVRPNHETNINIIARRTGKDVNSHTVLDGIITTIMATIQRINIIGSREGSRNRRRLKANQTGKKFRVGIKSNISTNRNNLIDRKSGSAGMPRPTSYAVFCLKKKIRLPPHQAVAQFLQGVARHVRAFVAGASDAGHRMIAVPRKL